ncbi:MAG TPA: hypothetical protein VFP74_06830 [Pseudolabrys sp.]|jgi:hypothetical protein|nr:hypothetical protein [Pseudolabrys sp.]
MHKPLLLILTAAVAGLAIFAGPAAAQQKTVKACEQEWRANKAANQAAGITEKAYVEKCRAGTAAAQPAPAATTAKPAAAPTTAAKPTKTVKACEDEWRANRAANQAAGVTQKSYVEKCRAGTAAAQPAPTAAPAAPPPSRTTTTTPPPATSRPSQPAATAPSTPPAPAATRTPAAGQPAGANQYATEAQAKARCPSDTVVWANLDSKIYHYSTNRNYGQTKSGAYMCEKDTAAAGIRAAKNEKRP